MPAQSCLRSFHPNPEAPHRLVICPFAGGNAASFNRLSGLLSHEVDVAIAQYPGRLDRHGEPWATSIQELAAEVLASITWADPRPVTLLGHSMGAIVAFEVTRMAEENGHDVSALIASASVAPSAAGPGVERWLDVSVSLESLAALGNIPAELALDPETLRFLTVPLQNDCRLLASYDLGEDVQVNAPVFALGGAEDAEVGAGSLLRWGSHARGPFEVKVFRGGHFYLVEDLPALAHYLHILLSARHAPSVGRGG